MYSTRRDAQIVTIGERELPRIERGARPPRLLLRGHRLGQVPGLGVPGGFPGLPAPERQECAVRRSDRRAGRRHRPCQKRSPRPVSRRAPHLLRNISRERPSREHHRPRRRAELRRHAAVHRRVAAASAAGLCHHRRGAGRPGGARLWRGASSGRSSPASRLLTSAACPLASSSPASRASRPTPRIYYLLADRDGAGEVLLILWKTSPGFPRLRTHPCTPRSTRRWTGASSEGASKIRRCRSRHARPACPPPCTVRRSRGRHPGVVAESQRQPGRLAPAATLGHPRVRPTPRHPCAVRGTVRLGPVLGSTSSVRRRRSGADAPHCRTGRASATTAAGGNPGP